MIDSTLIWKYHISYVCTNSPRTYICLWQTEMFVWGCAGGLMGSHVTESIFSNSARSYSQLANHKPYLSSWYPLDIKSLAWYGYNILVTCARGAQKAKVYFFLETIGSPSSVLNLSIYIVSIIAIMVIKFVEYYLTKD